MSESFAVKFRQNVKEQRERKSLTKGWKKVQLIVCEIYFKNHNFIQSSNNRKCFFYKTKVFFLNLWWTLEEGSLIPPKKPGVSGIEMQFFLTPAGWQGQVKGSDCQCLLMGPAEGGDSPVISAMMMSYCFSRAPQVHTYLWCAAAPTPATNICLTQSPVRGLTKLSQNQMNLFKLTAPLPH